MTHFPLPAKSLNYMIKGSVCTKVMRHPFHTCVPRSLPRPLGAGPGATLRTDPELAPTLPAPGLQKVRTWVLDMSWTSASQGQGVVKGGSAGCRAGAEF